MKILRAFFSYFLTGLGYLIHGVFRALGLLFLLVFLLAVIVYMGVRSSVNEERIKALFEAQIQELVHRPVQIEKVLITPRGIKLKGLRIVAGPDMPGKNLLTSDTVLATVKLSSLWRRRLEFEQVKLIAPSVELARDEEGRWSVADILVSTRPVEALPSGRFSFSMSLAAERTILSHGVVRIDDRRHQRVDLYENVDVEIDHFDLERPFAFAFSCVHTGAFSGRTVHSVLQTQGMISLASGDLSRVSLRARRIALVTEGKAVQGSGAFVGLPPSQVEVDLFLPELGPGDFKRLLGANVKFSLPAGQWRFEAQRTSERSLQIRKLSLTTPSFEAVAHGAVDLSSATLEGELSVSHLPLESAGLFYPPWRRLGLRGVLRAEAVIAGPWRRVKLKGGRLHAAGVAGRFKNLILESGDLSLGASDNAEKWTFSMTGGSGRIFATPFSGAAIVAVLNHDDLRLDRLSLNLIGSRLDLKARVRSLANPKEVMVAGAIDRVRWEDAQALIADFASRISTRAARAQDSETGTWVRSLKYSIPKSFPDTVGHVTISAVAHKNFSLNNVDMLWDIRGVSPSLKRVSGDVVVSFGSGRVNDIPAVQAANKFLRIIFLPFVYMHKMNNLSVFSTATAYPKTLDFNRIEGDYSLRHGVATTRLFYVDSPQVVAYADGWADFAKETVDLNIMTRLTGYRQPLPEWWVDELGRPAISFGVKGNLNLPDLDPRLSKMAGDEIEKALAEARAKAKKRTAVLDKLRRW